MADSVTVRQLVKATKLEVYSGSEYLDARQVVLSDISRPGLELTGYFNYYPHERIQLFGRTEISFARNMSSEERLLILKRMATEDTPAFLVSRGLQPPAEMITAATAAHIPVLGSRLPTTRLSSLITEYLDSQLFTVWACSLLAIPGLENPKLPWNWFSVVIGSLLMIGWMFISKMNKRLSELHRRFYPTCWRFADWVSLMS